MLNNDTEEMLWIKKASICVPILTFCLCISYLPPENSSRHVRAETFFDILLENVYMYHHEGIFVICGDLNGRIGSHSDYIEGVDKIPERSILDYKHNKHGETLIDFLLRADMCVMNGRGRTNDFTSVSLKGASLVDYCIVHHDDLQKICDFRVTRACEVFEKMGVWVISTLSTQFLITHYCHGLSLYQVLLILILVH